MKINDLTKKFDVRFKIRTYFNTKSKWQKGKIYAWRQKDQRAASDATQVEREKAETPPCVSLPAFC
jgi:hypothetical protein